MLTGRALLTILLMWVTLYKFSEDAYLCILTAKSIEVIFQMYKRLITSTEFSIVFRSINMTFVLRNNHARLCLIDIKQETLIDIKQPTHLWENLRHNHACLWFLYVLLSWLYASAITVGGVYTATITYISYKNGVYYWDMNKITINNNDGGHLILAVVPSLDCW